MRACGTLETQRVSRAQTHNAREVIHHLLLLFRAHRRQAASKQSTFPPHVSEQSAHLFTSEERSGTVAVVWGAEGGAAACVRTWTISGTYSTASPART